MPRGNTKKSKRAKYRSGLERTNALRLHRYKVPFNYESIKIPFEQPAMNRVYTPDFPLTTLGTGKTIIVECKGIWDAADRQKHLWIRQQHPDLDIRFVFTNSNTKISKRSKVTYADICNGLGRGPFKNVVWQYADKKIPKEWIYE